MLYLVPDTFCGSKTRERLATYCRGVSTLTGLKTQTNQGLPGLGSPSLYTKYTFFKTGSHPHMTLLRRSYPSPVGAMPRVALRDNAARKGGHRFRRSKKKEGVPLGLASKIPQQALNILRVQVAYQNIYAAAGKKMESGIYKVHVPYMAGCTPYVQSTNKNRVSTLTISVKMINYNTT